MELQQELLWKIVERELGMGLISCGAAECRGLGGCLPGNG